MPSLLPLLSFGSFPEGGSHEHRLRPPSRRLRELNKIREATYETFRKGIEHPDAEISANVIIGLIRVASYLLNRQLRQLEGSFLAEGGLRERMTRARLRARREKDIRDSKDIKDF